MKVYMRTPHYITTTVVRFGEDDFGVYARGMRNEFGTSLAARGTLDEVLAFRREMAMTRMERAEARRAEREVR